MHTTRPHKTEQRSILITGANGFTGLHACHYFANAGYTVYALVRTPSKIPPHKNINERLCDLNDKQSIKKILHMIKPHFILHLAGQNSVPTSWSDPINTFESNVMCTAYLLDAIRTESNDSKTIIVGSVLQSNLSFPSSFQHPYALSKTIQTGLSGAYGSLFELDVIIANPSNLIGPGHSTGVCSLLAQKVARMEKGQEEKKLVVHNLLAKRNFLDVRDAVKAYGLLFSKGKTGEVYEIASEKMRSIGEITDILKQISTIDFEVHSLTEQQEITPMIYATAIKELGWAPAVPFDQSILEILNFQRKNIV